MVNRQRYNNRKAFSSRQTRAAVFASLLAPGFIAIAPPHGAHAFAPSILPLHSSAQSTSPSVGRTALWYTDGATRSTFGQDTELPGLSEMSSREMKRELESYGVSTKSMFDRADFETALRYARLEGMTPPGPTSASSAEDVIEEFKFARENTKRVDDVAQRSKAETGASKKVWGKRHSASPSGDNTSSSSRDKDTRQELFERAMDMAKDMKISDLKQELKARAVEVKGFFEKADFVKAFANAIADKIPKKTQANTSTNDSKGSNSKQRAGEGYDPSYRDVSMQIVFPRMIEGKSVIDITDLFIKANKAGSRI